MPRDLAVFDLDGTITRHDTFTPFVFGWLRRHPLRSWRLVLLLPTLLSFFVGRADRGDLKGALLHVTLGGEARTTVEGWAEDFIGRLLRDGVFAAAMERIAYHRQAGHRLVLMSASVDCYVPRIGRQLGFEETLCTEVRWNADGTLDGRLAGPNCRGEQKRRHLQALRKRIPNGEIWAYGNSRADLAHMLLATQPVYVNGSPGNLPAGAPSVKCVQWR